LQPEDWVADDDNYSFYMFNVKDKDVVEKRRAKVDQAEARLPPLPYPLRTSETIPEPRHELRLVTKENVVKKKNQRASRMKLASPPKRKNSISELPTNPESDIMNQTYVTKGLSYEAGGTLEDQISKFMIEDELLNL
jgi:hypothetical protein